MMNFEPAYLKLLDSGELKSRLETLEAEFANCNLCPRKCGVDRIHSADGFCQADCSIAVDSVCAHRGEEPFISGTKGSGTVFFSACNLRCIFCQNHQISHRPAKTAPYKKSAEIVSRILYLQNRIGVHNINFVSPSHMVPQMVRIIYEAAKSGLRLPIVYNSNGYDSVETLGLLDGIVDIYMPDLKYFDLQSARRYSQAKDYPEVARAALLEMQRQVGSLQIDANGLARRGLLVRHLVLPNDLAGTEEVLGWISQTLGKNTAVSLMSQYYPAYKAPRVPLLSRSITYIEYQRALRALEKYNLRRGLIQELNAPENYQPDFNRESHPFEKSELSNF